MIYVPIWRIVIPVTAQPPVPLLEIANPFSLGYGRLYLNEPLDAPLEPLRRRLIDGTYAKPFILDDGQRRALHFGLAFVQSAMYLDDPLVLRLRYTQKMMGFLLFMESPAHIVQIGLGGGSLAKYCHHHLANTRMTVIEVNPDVVALRDHFGIPPDDERFRVIRDDGAHYVSIPGPAIDVLLVDAYDGRGMAPTLAGMPFLQSAFERLSEAGILVVNLSGDRTLYDEFVDVARSVFRQHVWVIPVSADGNHVLYAFKDGRFQPDWRRIRIYARALGRRHAFDFGAIAQLMAHAAALGPEG